MSSDRNQTLRHKSRPSKMESTTEGVRLDALIASPPPKARQSVFPSRAGDSSGRTQKVWFEKSMMKSNLDQTQRVGAEKSVMRSNLDQTKKETQYKTATPKEIPHLSDAFGARTRRPESDAVRPSHGCSTKNKYQSSMPFGSRPGPSASTRRQSRQLSPVRMISTWLLARYSMRLLRCQNGRSKRNGHRRNSRNWVRAPLTSNGYEYQAAITTVPVITR